MSIPVLEKNSNFTMGYFPVNSGWYDFFDGNYVINKKDGDRHVKIINYLDDFIPLF